MRFHSFSLTTLSIGAALALCLGGCSTNENRAESTYHPAPASWVGTAGTDVHANANPTTNVEGTTTTESAAGTTRETAGVGGTGGGPTDGTATKGEHKGHFGQTTGTVDDGAKPVSRTGK